MKLFLDEKYHKSSKYLKNNQETKTPLSGCLEGSSRN